MAKPDLMKHADWINDTTVKKFFSSDAKDRSQSTATKTGLQSVDLYLDLYEKCTDNKWPALLRQLDIVLDAWIASKTKKDGSLNTIRDHNTVLDLQTRVRNARTFPNPLPWDNSYPGISIAQDPFACDFEVPATFSGDVRNDLTSLISKPKGKALVAMLSKACRDKGHEVVIQYFTKGSSNCAPVNVPITNEFRRSLSEPNGVNMTELMGNKLLVALGKRNGSNGPEFTPNTGANAVVRYDPADAGFGEEKGRPSCIALAHELVHAYHFVNGICARQPTGGTSGDQGGAEEEMRAVGALAYLKDPPSENWIREEWSLKMRTSYSGNDFTQTTATLFT